MASYSPAKKNAAFVLYVSLRSQADVRLFQVNPTLASGDVKVSKDGGALSNVATLPSVVSSSAIVKVELSSTEMNADNVTVLFSDAAGGQWCDLVLNIQTAGQQFDDLATAAALNAVDDYVDTEIAAIKAKTDLIPASPAAVGSAMTLADGAITSAKFAAGAITAGVIAADAIGASELAADAVAEIQSGLATAAALSTVAGYVDTEVAAIKAKTDLIPASPAAVGSAMTLAADAVNASALAADAVAEIQSGLSTLTAGDVNAQMVDVLVTDTYGEPGSVPGATSSLKDKIGWVFMLARNKRTTTATADKVRNDGDSGDVGSAVLSDDGSTFTRGEYA